MEFVKRGRAPRIVLNGKRPTMTNLHYLQLLTFLIYRPESLVDIFGINKKERKGAVSSSDSDRKKKQKKSKKAKKKSDKKKKVPYFF